MNYLGIITVTISLASLMLAGYTYTTKAQKDNTTELTTVIVKLESIGSGISDIKREIESMKTDQKEDHDELIKVGESLRSAWKQINRLSGGRASEEGSNE